MWIDQRWIDVYKRYTSCYALGYCAWVSGLLSEMGKDLSARDEESQGRVVWAAERFTAKRRAVINLDRRAKLM